MSAPTVLFKWAKTKPVKSKMGKNNTPFTVFTPNTGRNNRILQLKQSKTIKLTGLEIIQSELLHYILQRKN